MSGLPLLVQLAGRPVVVVGAGAVAARKVAALREVAAAVTVVAPDAVPPIAHAAAAGHLDWHERTYKTGDLDGAFLAVAATDAPECNALVAQDAEAAHTLCVRADDGGTGSAAFLAAVRRGDLLLAVSTSGAAPSVARRLRAELEDRYGPEYAELVALLGELRDAPAVRARLEHLDGQERAAAWRALPVPDILAALRTGDRQTATELASACLCSSSD